MSQAVILMRSHVNPALTLHRIRKWHEANPDAQIIFYDGTEGRLGIRSDPRCNLVVFPNPRPQAWGYPQLFDAFRWIAEQFPGSFCHYTEYDSVPVRQGYLDQLEVHPAVILAGEAKFGAPVFRNWYEESRVRAVEVVGKILNVPVKLSYAFGPSMIFGASCVKYLGRFDAEDFERHIFPALDRIQKGYSYDEVILMSLLAGRGYVRQLNPAAKYILFEPCDEQRFREACLDEEAFAVHAVKSDEPWAR